MRSISVSSPERWRGLALPMWIWKQLAWETVLKYCWWGSWQHIGSVWEERSTVWAVVTRLLIVSLQCSCHRVLMTPISLTHPWADFGLPSMALPQNTSKRNIWQGCLWKAENTIKLCIFPLILTSKISMYRWKCNVSHYHELAYSINKCKYYFLLFLFIQRNTDHCEVLNCWNLKFMIKHACRKYKHNIILKCTLF